MNCSESASTTADSRKLENSARIPPLFGFLISERWHMAHGVALSLQFIGPEWPKLKKSIFFLSTARKTDLKCNTSTDLRGSEDGIC
jgi:hypothetical protein